MTTLTVFCARSMTQAVNRLAGDFMSESGHRVDITFGPVGTLQAKLTAGETADVLVLGGQSPLVSVKDVGRRVRRLPEDAGGANLELDVDDPHGLP